MGPRCGLSLLPVQVIDSCNAPCCRVKAAFDQSEHISAYKPSYVNINTIYYTSQPSKHQGSLITVLPPPSDEASWLLKGGTSGDARQERVQKILSMVYMFNPSCGEFIPQTVGERQLGKSALAGDLKWCWRLCNGRGGNLVILERFLIDV